MVGGEIAVQFFYSISGFYMALVLTSKYSSYKNFTYNRILRLLPIYLCVLFFSVIFYLFFKTDSPFSAYEYALNKGSYSIIISSIFSNLFILGQDALIFIGILNDGKMGFGYPFNDYSMPGYRFLFVPQAWTLSIELMFYFLAPFLVKLRNYMVILIIMVSLLIRYLADVFFELNFDPWTYRFFPFEISYFLFGILSYRLYFHLKKYFTVSFRFAPYFFALIILFYNKITIPFFNNFKELIFYTIFILLLPYFFHVTKSNKFDRSIGELSYPIYISHILIIQIINFSSIHFLSNNIKSLVIISTTIAISFLLNKFIAQSFERNFKITENL